MSKISKTVTVSQITCLIVQLLGICLFSSYAIAFEEPAWQRLETCYTVILYKSEKDLEVFTRKIELSCKTSLLYFFNRHKSSLKHLARSKVDRIFQKVQELLEMKRPLEQKVTIKLFPDKNCLKKAYQYLYNDDGIPRAWYNYHNNTIYLNVMDLHAGMLAHEITHAVIDNYLLIHPPRATAEILAQYVDTHIHK